MGSVGRKPVYFILIACDMLISPNLAEAVVSLIHMTEVLNGLLISKANNQPAINLVKLLRRDWS